MRYFLEFLTSIFLILAEYTLTQYKFIRSRCHGSDFQYADTSIDLLYRRDGVVAEKRHLCQLYQGGKGRYEDRCRDCASLIGLMIAVGVLRASGFLEFAGSVIGRIIAVFSDNFPNELVSLFVVKLFSASAATGLALDIYKEYGTDSFAGLATSLALASTETVFYTMSVYFMAAKVTKTRWTLGGALLATFSGLVASVLLAGVLAY